MTDDVFHNLSAKDEIKDPKGSLRRKYHRRLRNLAHTLDDFILHAEQRLDVAKAGKIRKRAEVEELLENCTALRAVIPVESRDDEKTPPEIYRNLCDSFGLDPNLSEDPSK